MSQNNDDTGSVEVAGKVECKKLSVLDASLLLLSTGIGTGVLVLPKGTAEVGFLPMLGLLCLGGCISAFTTWILLMAVLRYLDKRDADSTFDSAEGMDQIGSSSVDSPDYSCLLGEVVPRWTVYFLDLAVVLYAEGSVITHFLFLADSLCTLSFWPAVLTVKLTVILIAFLVFPALLFPTVGSLARFSSLPLIALGVMALAMFAKMPKAVRSRATALEGVGDLTMTPSVMCMCVFAYMWHTNCVAVACELRNPTPWRFAVVSLGGGGLLFIVYACIALAGYISWGDALLDSESVVDMYSIDDPMFIVVRSSLSASLLLATIINMYPLRESGCALLKVWIPAYELTAWNRTLWAASLVTITAATAIIYPDVCDIIVLMGGTLTAMLMLIFPALIAKLVFSVRVWLWIVFVLTAFSSILVVAAFGLLGRSDRHDTFHCGWIVGVLIGAVLLLPAWLFYHELYRSQAPSNVLHGQPKQNIEMALKHIHSHPLASPYPLI